MNNNLYDYNLEQCKIFPFSKPQKLFEKILDVQGSIVECGVYKADSLMTYFHLSNIYEPFSFTRKVIGFDTFEVHMMC